VPASAVSFACCGRPEATGAGAAVLALVVVACRWRGEGFARGVAPGLLAGLCPLLLPVVARLGNFVCDAGTCTLSTLSCLLAGALGGAVLGGVAARQVEGRGGFLVAAAAHAALSGSLGCLLGGVAGLAGMAIGLLAGAAPALVLAARRA
jgi:hypothetical protein